MDLFLYIVVIPIAVYLIARKLDTYYHVGGNRTLLLIACALFAISPIIPSPPIHGQDTQFLTHFFGGGIFMGLIWLYFKPAMKSLPWYYELFSLYVLTCAFGVLNELYELFAHEAHLNPRPITDTSWDLFANTLGMLVFYGCYLGIRFVKRLSSSR
jgi:hypothetical protein